MMKLNKKNKGKVHPSPPSSSSPPLLHSTSSKDAVSALKLLPAVILTLIAVLTPDEREVLAYLITRSIKATENLSLLLQENGRRRSSSKRTPSTAEHKQPLFDCGCFDCYTSYWFRWDSSTNRELIHQAIEAFEEHLATGERSPKKAGKRRDKMGGVRQSSDAQTEVPESSTAADGGTLADFPAEEVADLLGPAVEGPPEGVDDDSVAEVKSEASPARAVAAGAGGNHKGLARKVLPDVIGLFNSRLWSLWSPNV